MNTERMTIMTTTTDQPDTSRDAEAIGDPGLVADGIIERHARDLAQRHPGNQVTSTYGHDDLINVGQLFQDLPGNCGGAGHEGRILTVFQVSQTLSFRRSVGLLSRLAVEHIVVGTDEKHGGVQRSQQQRMHAELRGNERKPIRPRRRRRPEVRA